MNTPVITSFIVYLIGMLSIGIYFYLRTKNLSDYVLGGRQLSGAVAALSAGASDMSGWLLLGLPGAMYVGGMNSIWIGIGLVIGAYLNWQFIAKRLRIFTEGANDSITLPDYLENRFNDSSRVLRVASAIVILVFFTIYTSAGMVGGAILFKQTFGLDYNVALWVGALVIVSYTFLGGYMAVCWTDFFQGTMMFIALLCVPMIALGKVGGLNAAITKIASMNANQVDVYSGMTWMVLSLLGAIFTGFLGIAYFADQPLQNSETVFMGLAQELFNPWIAGFLLAAILAAIMSTIDSQLLVCSSAIAEDFYKQIFRREASQKELVWISRIAVLVIALIAILMAENPDSRVLGLVAYAWGGFGAAFGPVIILSLFWKRMTRNGTLAGMIVGAVTVIVWKQIEGGIFDIYEILPGFVLCAISIVVVSLLDKAPDENITLQFENLSA